MKKRAAIIVPIIILVIIAMDIYVFRSSARQHFSAYKKAYAFVYWSLNGLFYLAIFSAFVIPSPRSPYFLTAFFFIGTGFMMLLFPKILYISLDLILAVCKKTYSLLYHVDKPFKALVYTRTGIIFLILGIFLYGILQGRFQYTIKEVSIRSEKIPASFKGTRIVHISDLHLGSFVYNTNKLRQAVSLINSLEPDYIFFTGDIVNEFSEELIPVDSILINLKAKHGKFSVLGNHDYGDYYPWKDTADKIEHLANVKFFHKKNDFILLLNESVYLTREKEKIQLIGVENWGKPPFHAYGDLKKAMEGKNNPDVFKILLSHDPSHWDAEVKDSTDIDLTLSGHTHGMQFGIEMGTFKWSPVKYMYPRWSGLYQSNNQYLYVNRGLGYIGLMARIGMWPEITVIELR